MRKFLRNLFTWLTIALGIGSVFALSYKWTSFFKTGDPITLPPTQFISWGVISGNYTSGWVLLMQIGQSWANYSFIPLLDWSWNAYLTWESDPVWIAMSSWYYTTGQIDQQLSAFAWGLIYKWTRDMSWGNFPINMNTGDFYKISVEWTGDWKYYGVGDMMIGNKKKSWWTNSNDWDRIVNVVAPEIDPIWTLERSWYYTTGQIDSTLLWYVLQSSTGNRNIAYNRVHTSSGNSLYFWNNSWSYLPRTWSFVYPGNNLYSPSIKAVVDYIEIMAQNLGDIITTWSMIRSWESVLWNCINWQRSQWISWGNLRTFWCTGNVWLDVGWYTHP